MSKHTKGPWRHGSQTGANANCVYAANGQGPHDEPSICAVYGIPLYRRIDEPMRDIYDEGVANARLIAAAPELLVALKALLIECDESVELSCVHSHDTVESARAAVAKAAP